MNKHTGVVAAIMSGHVLEEDLKTWIEQVHLGIHACCAIRAGTGRGRGIDHAIIDAADKAMNCLWGVPWLQPLIVNAQRNARNTRALFVEWVREGLEAFKKPTHSLLLDVAWAMKKYEGVVSYSVVHSAECLMEELHSDFDESVVRTYEKCDAEYNAELHATCEPWGMWQVANMAKESA